MHWRILPLMMVFVALAHFNRISITVAGAEKIIPAGLLSAEQMGWVYSIFLIIYALCMAPGGWFLDRFGPRTAWLVLVFGSVGFVAATGLVGWYVTDPSMLFVALLLVRGGFGVVCAPLHPTAARLVANWVPASSLDLANGLINAAALVGISFTYLLFGELIDLFDWPKAFMICGGITLGLALLWLLFGADHPPRQTSAVPPPGTERRLLAGFGVLSDRSLLCLTLSYGLLGYFQYLFFYWAEYYFKNQMQLSTQASRCSSTPVLTLAMGVGMFLGGWVSDSARRRLPGQWGVVLVPILALEIAGIATFCSLLDVPRSSVVLALTIAMGAAGISEGAYWTTAVRLGRHYGGTAAAIMNTAGNGIGLTAPLLTPWISTNFGWRASLVLAAVVCWTAALCWLGVRSSSEPEA